VEDVDRGYSQSLVWKEICDQTSKHQTWTRVLIDSLLSGKDLILLLLKRTRDARAKITLRDVSPELLS
jgi:hypothetical protein